MKGYHVNHLIKSAHTLVRSYHVETIEKALDILAKSLLFKGYAEISENYNLNESKGYFLEDFTSEDCIIKRDIVSHGFCFSPYILAHELNIEEEDAQDLKLQIDKHRIPKRIENGNGNICYSDRHLAIRGLQRIRPGDRKRLMAEFPLEFYVRQNNIEFKTPDGVTREHELFYCDAFYTEYPEYFVTKENFIKTFVQTLNLILSVNNILIDHYCREVLETYFPENYNYLRTQYRCLDVKYNSWLELTGLLVIPSNTLTREL
ncbi:MAG: hypothetical protein AAF600_07240 [Bacteroidota bacterium]